MHNPVELIIDTPFGKARLVVHGKDSCYLGNIHPLSQNPLPVNRVEYSISLHAERHNGVWTYQHNSSGQPQFGSLHMSRLDWATSKSGNNDPSFAARDKASQELFALLNSYFAEHPEVLVAGEKQRLQNLIVGQKQKRKEAILLQEEAQCQLEATRAELLALSTPEERMAQYNEEWIDLIKEREHRSRRDAVVTEREPELQDLSMQTKGRRGACSRYLASDEITRLGDHFSAGDEADCLGEYLRESVFSHSNGRCYEVPVTHEEARMLDQACAVLGIGQ